MKKELFIIGLFMLLGFVSCDFGISGSIDNNSDKKIIAFLKEELNRAENDTILPVNIDAKWERLLCQYNCILPHRGGLYFEDIGGRCISWRSSFSGIDTLHLFILDADSLQTYGWEECVRRGNMFLQRYDLSIDALENGTSPSLSYPPTPEMGRYIKMWPPYNFDE